MVTREQTGISSLKNMLRVNMHLKGVGRTVEHHHHRPAVAYSFKQDDLIRMVRSYKPGFHIITGGAERGMLKTKLQ